LLKLHNKSKKRSRPPFASVRKAKPLDRKSQGVAAEREYRKLEELLLREVGNDENCTRLHRTLKTAPLLFGHIPHIYLYQEGRANSYRGRPYSVGFGIFLSLLITYLL
jgi:hypothetical protein